MTTVLLDSHLLHWWSAEPDRMSPAARTAVAEAEELAVASITWFELAWLANPLIPTRNRAASGAITTRDRVRPTLRG